MQDYDVSGIIYTETEYKQINYPNEKDFSFVGLRGNGVYIYRLFER